MLQAPEVFGERDGAVYSSPGPKRLRGFIPRVSQWRGAGEGLEGTQRLPSWGEAGSQNWRRPLLHGSSDSLGALGWGPGIYVFSSSFLLLPLR